MIRVAKLYLPNKVKLGKVCIAVPAEQWQLS